MKIIRGLALIFLFSSALIAGEPRKKPVPDEIKKELFDLLLIYPIGMEEMRLSMDTGDNESAMHKNMSIKDIETRLSALGKDDKYGRARLLLGMAAKLAVGGITNEAKKFADEACGIYTELLAATPDNAKILEDKIWAFCVGGRTGDAAAELASFAEKHPDKIPRLNSALLLIGGGMNFDSDKFQKLVGIYDAYYEKGKKDAGISGDFIKGYINYRSLILILKYRSTEKVLDALPSFYNEENRKMVDEWVKTADDKTAALLFKGAYNLYGSFSTLMKIAKDDKELNDTKFANQEDALKAAFKKYPSVKQDLDNALALLASIYNEYAPRYSQIYGLIGTAKAFLGEWKDAEKYFFEGLKAAPLSEKAFMRLITVYLKLYLEKDEKTLREKLAPLADMLQAARKDGYYTKNTLHDLGYIYYKIGKYDNAVECFEFKLNEYPPDFDGQFAYGTALIRAGKYEDGVEVLRTAQKMLKSLDKESDSDNQKAMCMYNNAMIGLALNGEAEKAVNLLEQMLKAGATEKNIKSVLAVIKKMK
jgi:pentatricopeptide repeat protein